MKTNGETCPHNEYQPHVPYTTENENQEDESFLTRSTMSHFSPYRSTFSVTLLSNEFLDYPYHRLWLISHLIDSYICMEAETVVSIPSVITFPGHISMF